MDIMRFDSWTRNLSATSSRRQAFVALLLGAIMARFASEEASAGPGCKNVGKQCKRKKDCCSGICKGKKGKKTCRAHDTGGCSAGQQSGICGGVNVACTTSVGKDGRCQTTTGNGAYCNEGGLICTPCQRDADCRSDCGPMAACIQCAESCAVGTACVGPIACS